MIFIFLGEDTLGKDKELEAIKKKFLSSDNALSFDYEVLYGIKLDSAVLKKALVAIPVVGVKRVVVIRSFHKLDLHNKKLILEFAQIKDSSTVLILDSPEGAAKNSFMTKLSALAKVSRHTKGAVKRNVFDMTKAMSSHQPIEVFKILNGLLADGQYPLKIMGGLVWYWGKMRERLPSEKFRQGLLDLEEADLNIKRSRLKPEQAVEVVVMKLLQNL